MNINFEWQPSSYRALLLFLFSLVSYGLMYVTNIILAKTLTVDEFDDYSVSLSVVTLLSTIGALGLEKYALRAIAVFNERQDWQKFRGFWLFSIRVIIGFSLFLFAILGIGLESLLAFYQADYHIAIVIYAGFLPVIITALFLVEVSSALGKYISAFAVYRLLLPLIYLSFIYLLTLRKLPLSAIVAVLSYGFAWIIVLMVLWLVVKYITPISVSLATPLITSKKWLSRSLPLVISSLLMTIMTSSGVIILELLFPSGIEVGIYAVAAQTGSLITLVGTSTNRYYLPTMVVLIEQKNKVEITRLSRQRTLTIGFFILALFLIIAVFGHFILSLFGGRFSEGYLTLVFIAAGACFSAFFADVQYYLQYMNANRLVLEMTLISAVLMVLFAFHFGKEFGALGVAMSYMATVSLLFISLRLVLQNKLNAM